MTSLEPLRSTIYHERQQQGSALCAQHALNNLLQGSYFSAPDLSDLARNLDLLEQSYQHDPGNENSMNMDDTGFFSVQVMENALKVWGLSLVRWRSEEMRIYHDRPHAQLAFILNLEQHWFTLRRFGRAEPDVDKNTDDGHWFNLNSFLSSPEWVGKLYLSMVLEQSEAEGYSVFAVIQSDPTAPLALPRTDADMIASTLSGPDGVLSPPPAQSTLGGRNDNDELDGFEEEDFELQAALQASLNHNSSPVQGDVADVGTRPVTPPLSQQDSDPVRAGIERNRLMLQHMREQQEYARREALAHVTEGMTEEQAAALEARREARRRQEEEEEENLRQAIAESEAMAKKSSSTSVSPRRIIPDGPYDDNDAELQAALKASLEHVNGVQVPDTRRDGIRTTEAHHDPPHPDDATELTPSAVPSITLDIDDLRKKRLAKFGS